MTSAMTYTTPYKFSAALACVGLIACGDTSETPNFDESGPAIELAVTAQVMLPEKGVAYAFVPNDAAQWLSQIIILSEDGDLYQATADTREAKPIKGPKAKSIIGLNRPGAAGMFLAVNPDDTVQAYIESNDEGDFKLYDQTATNLTIADLCEEAAAVDCELNKQGEIIGVITESSAFLTSEIGNINLKAGKTRIAVSSVTAPDAYEMVAITNGITIPGVANPQSVYAVSDNFGGPFNNGLVLVSDADEPRFAIISADFARKTLAASLAD